MQEYQKEGIWEIREKYVKDKESGTKDMENRRSSDRNIRRRRIHRDC